MAVIIGSARHDEHGACYSGGAAGDQLQSGSGDDYSGEVSMQDFYVHSKGWYVLRPKSADIANKIAANMKTACNNANIGYDQNQRNGIITYGVNTKTKTECDCSSLVRECVKEASGKDPGDFTTANEATALENTGLFESKFKYSSGTSLATGDVIVTCSKGHTCIVVSGASRSSSSSSSGSSGSSGSTSSSGGTVKATGTASSKDASLSGTYKTTASLNVRNDAGATKKLMVTIPKDTSVQNYGYYSTASGTKWLYIQFKYNGTEYIGFASSKYLTKTSSSSSSSSGSSGSTTSSSSGSLSVDGKIGTKTVKKLQKVMGSTQDGLISGQQSASKKYWTSILSEACKWNGGASTVVKKLQQYVKDAGYSPGSVDGKLGQNTAKAVQNYLKAKGYSPGTVDGIFGSNSAKALQKWLNTK